MTKLELVPAFVSAMETFFNEIPNSIRSATRPLLEIMDEEADAVRVTTPDGTNAGAVRIGTPKGDCLEVYFGHAPNGDVALRLDLKATNFKALSALVDIASAGMVGLDGVSMVEGWAAR